MEWGYLRETREEAKKAGLDPDTKLCRTGLIDYLLKIFPDTLEEDWIHDKTLGSDCSRKVRPDFRNERKKLIIEFDGLQHYTNPKNIVKDKENSKYYESLGYKVVRIPYFIQLTKTVIKQMFGVEINEEMFPNEYGSMGPNSGCTPAFIPHLGLVRMAQDFKKYPEQYKINMDTMKKYEEQQFVEWEFLEKEYNKLK